MEAAERELVLKAQQGDGAAFARLVQRHDRTILALAFDLVGNADDAQDVFQEALLAAYRGLPRFRMDSGFATWLYRIAVHKALKFRRRRQRTAQGEQEAAVAEADRSSGSEAELLAAEMRAQFDQGLEQLSAQERAAFVLCHRQGFRIDQAASLMDCSPGAVKSYLFRGREKMKVFLRCYLER